MDLPGRFTERILHADFLSPRSPFKTHTALPEVADDRESRMADARARAARRFATRVPGILRDDGGGVVAAQSGGRANRALFRKCIEAEVDGGQRNQRIDRGLRRFGGTHGSDRRDTHTGRRDRVLYEFSSGQRFRSVHFPEPIVPEAVIAECRNGLLTIAAPISQSRRRRRRAH